METGFEKVLLMFNSTLSFIMVIEYRSDDVIKNEICEIMGFVKTFRKNNVQRVISKSNERAARVRFEITSMISDQNCTTRSFSYHFITSILKSLIFFNLYYWSTRLVRKKRNRKRVYMYVACQQNKMKDVTLPKTH